MSCILSPQGAVVATAMAVSGTVILLVFRHLDNSSSRRLILPSCISSDGKKKKKNKKVRFAKDVVDPMGDAKEFRRKVNKNNDYRKSCKKNSKKNEEEDDGKSKRRGIPANRLALYNGILRDRLLHRSPYSYS